MATVVVLNGTSSSGKTTVARAFQNLAPGLFLNFSIDSILYALPQRDLDRITGGADVSDLDIAALVRAYYACVRRLLDLGHDLVIDHAVTARYHAEHLLAAVSSHRVLMVGLDCSAEVLLQRERERGDRRAGMALAQLAHIHSWLQYDLRFDTSEMPADEIARRIVQELSARA
jgi:chloramphenicol 3-O phosphotransferase